jgi:hypothetical protein
VHILWYIRKNNGFSTQEEHLVLLGWEALTHAPNLRYATRPSYGIPCEAPEVRRDDAMAAITIPDSVKRYFPQAIDPTQLWVNYNPKADTLTVYFTAHPVPSVWEDIDRYVYTGFASDDERRVTGVMIEHFSQWLLVEELKEDV